MRTRGVGRTDPGRIRRSNEDAFLVDDELGLYVVSDGMGGHLGGAVASQMAIEVVAREVQSRRTVLVRARHGEVAEDEIVKLARTAVLAACREVHAAAAESERQAGMGCTLTLVVVFGAQAVVAHVGDCRLYRVRYGEARQLSEDHTLARELSDEGLQPAGMMEPRYRHMLTREIGTSPTVEVDTSCFDVQAGDLLLLCSDGLSNYIQSERWLAERLGSAAGDTVVDALVRYANDAGGEDNITVLVVEVNGHSPKRAAAARGTPARAAAALQQGLNLRLAAGDDAEDEPQTAIFQRAGGPDAKRRAGQERDEPKTAILDAAAVSPEASASGSPQDDPTAGLLDPGSTDDDAITLDEFRAPPKQAKVAPRKPPVDDAATEAVEIDFEMAALDPELAEELLSSGELDLGLGGFPPVPETVAAASLLAGLPSEVRDALLEVSETEYYLPDEVVLRQGDSSTGLYVVTGGRLIRERSGHDPVTLVAGDHAELSGLFGEYPARATLLAPEPTRLLRVDRELFWELVRARPAVGVTLLERLAQELSRRLRLAE